MPKMMVYIYIHIYFKFFIVSIFASHHQSLQEQETNRRNEKEISFVINLLFISMIANLYIYLKNRVKRDKSKHFTCDRFSRIKYK